MTTSRKPVDSASIKPGSDPSKLVERIYSERRIFPRNAPPRERRDPASNDRDWDQGQRHGDPNTSAPQFIEDGRAANYSNDASGWVRGCKSGEPQMHSESGEHKPGFDKNQSYRHDDGGNRRGERDTKDYTADHNRHFSEFELHHNAGTTHAQEAHDYSRRHVAQYEKRGRNDLQPSVANRDGGEGKTTRKR
jgi:hypothetical protein